MFPHHTSSPSPTGKEDRDLYLLCPQLISFFKHETNNYEKQNESTFVDCDYVNHLLNFEAVEMFVTIQDERSGANFNPYNIPSL